MDTTRKRAPNEVYSQACRNETMLDDVRRSRPAYFERLDAAVGHWPTGGN